MEPDQAGRIIYFSKLLTAVAKEQVLRQPLSKGIADRYGLGPPGSVSRALDTLLNEEMIYSRFDRQGQVEYLVYDVYLSRWIDYKNS